jgi:hypothetical protein
MLLVDHRTLQVSCHHAPSWEVGTWGDDPRSRRDGVGSESVHGARDAPPDGGHHAHSDRHDGHRVHNDRHGARRVRNGCHDHRNGRPDHTYHRADSYPLGHAKLSY